jgi:multiple sugar transport system permease protein
MMNFLIAVAINLAGMLLIYSLMANALTRFYWHGRGTMSVLGTIIVSGLYWIVPWIVPPSVPSLGNLNFDAHALWLGNWLVSGFSVVILCQSVRWIPRALEDSARLDGCGWFGTYRHVVFPLVRRELALIALLTVMATSPVFWGLVLETPTGLFPLWLHLLLPIGSEPGPGLTNILLIMMGGSVIMTLPVMAIFFLSKSWFPRPAKLGNE